MMPPDAILAPLATPPFPPQWLTALMGWYQQHQRDLPWRRSRTPYHIWISEIMSQQTQLATVVPYFERFIQLFPDIATLAGADPQAVLKCWEGLGYYRRARHLQAAAQQVMTDHHGGLPGDYNTLQTLPGIGPYVAAAVASIAFGQPIPVVDGNVLRVFTRFWGIGDDIRLPKTRTRLFEALTPLIENSGDPGVFNQAMMEVGALRCHPQSPRCDACPLASACHAHHTQQTHAYPYKSTRAPIPHYTIGVGIIRNGDCVLVGKRPDHAMLGGLFEFPGGKQWPDEPIADTIRREVAEETQLTVIPLYPMAKVQHAYTHFKITLIAYECDWHATDQSPTPPFKWVPIHVLHTLPFPKANHAILSVLGASSLPERKGS